MSEASLNPEPRNLSHVLVVLEVTPFLLLPHLASLRRVVLCTGSKLVTAQRDTRDRNLRRISATCPNLDGRGTLLVVAPGVHRAEPLLVRPRRVPLPERVRYRVPAHAETRAQK
jgi:hypothetical protein